MRILFFDNTCPKRYTATSLNNEAMGGTEATVIRVSEGLRKLGFEVELHSHRFEPIPGKFDAVIAVRSPADFYVLQKWYPYAKHYLWMHDLYTKGPTPDEYYVYGNHTLVTVSDFHKTQVQERLKAFGVSVPFPRVRRIYNPIEDELKPLDTPYDKHKLVFFSSPHKGLDNVLKLFARLSSIDGDFRLNIANPGYYKNFDASVANVVNLGNLSHREVIKHVASSLLVFYPNTVFPETFGLVFAEANAVGTPVLAHKFGSASEVLRDCPSQVLDCRDEEEVVRRVLRYRDGDRPVVRAREDFRLKNVLQEWVSLLTSKT